MSLSLKAKRHLSISIRNLMITIVVFSIIVSASELSLRFHRLSTSAEQETVDYVKMLMMGFEKSSSDQLRSTTVVDNFIFYETSVEEQSLQKSDDVYPLIEDISTGNTYDKNTVNIVVLGDSFVWGACCLNRNELFWRLVENDLRKKGYNCRIYGVGISGANSLDELNWLANTSLVGDLNPDLILFSYVYNDQHPYSKSELPENFKFYSREETPFTSLINKLLPNIFEKLKNNVIIETLYEKENEYGSFSLSNGVSNVPIYILKGQFYELYKKNFVDPLNDYAAKSDFPISLMTMPLPKPYKAQKELYKPLYTLFSECSNISFYDGLYELCHSFASSKHSKNYFVNPADSHPGSATNRFYADYIIDFLEKDYADVLGKRSGRDLNNYDIFINDCMPGKLNLEEVSRTDNSVAYTLDYPSYNKQYSFLHYDFDNYFLNYPLGQDYIKLSFSQPQDLDSVTITGDGIENIDLYYTKLNEKLNYDDHKILPFGTKSSDGKTWTDDTSDKVMSLCIHADCKNDDGSKLQITISKKG